MSDKNPKGGDSATRTGIDRFKSPTQFVDTEACQPNIEFDQGSLVNSVKTIGQRRQSLKESAYERLKQMIVDGGIEAGSLISERQLGKALGVSGSPVRSAIERLKAEGLVSVSPQRGTVVRELSFTEIADQFEFRSVIESYIAGRLAGNINDVQVAQLKCHLAKQESAALAPDADVMLNVELDAEFHLLLCEFLGNSEMMTSLLRIRDRMKQAILRVNWRHEERLPDSFREHVAIAEAILNGDGASAEEEMRKHLKYGKSFLLSNGRER